MDLLIFLYTLDSRHKVIKTEITYPGGYGSTAGIMITLFRSLSCLFITIRTQTCTHKVATVQLRFLHDNKNKIQNQPWKESTFHWHKAKIGGKKRKKTSVGGTSRWWKTDNFTLYAECTSRHWWNTMNMLSAFNWLPLMKIRSVIQHRLILPL